MKDGLKSGMKANFSNLKKKVEEEEKWRIEAELKKKEEAKKK